MTITVHCDGQDWKAESMEGADARPPAVQMGASVRRQGEAANGAAWIPRRNRMKYPLTPLLAHASNLERRTDETTSTLSRIGIPTDLLWGGSCDA